MSAEQLSWNHEIEIDHWCIEFVQAWRCGQRPRIEDYLPRVEEALRSRLFAELLHEEFEHRRRVGEALDQREYLERFPDGQAAIAAGLGSQPIVDLTTPYPGQVQLEPPSESIPLDIGGFQIERILGAGGCGTVYLARDNGLNRQVAIKVPRQQMLRTADRELLQKEAQLVANLSLPGIVPVYQFLELMGTVAMVQRYIPGPNLGQWLERTAASRTFDQAAQMLAKVAISIGNAHGAQIVHRDLKPSNILIDEFGEPWVTDFGLAVNIYLRQVTDGISGTPHYMAPEQTLGERHRIDHRCDIWAIGVMLYECLTGRRPFQGRNCEELFQRIRAHDPIPPTQIDAAVPPELERICLKCLSRIRDDRYRSAAELAQELRSWRDVKVAPVATTTSAAPSALVPAVVPRGLQAYTEQDADFFLQLLPGPFGRDGLPTNLQFWKERIESFDPDRAFPAGLLYGPSGCGKTSFIRAGLIRRLDRCVHCIYVESSGNLLVQLQTKLRRMFPRLAETASLHELLFDLREGGMLPRGEKILLILDEFEQALQMLPGQESEFVQALRQCDGVRIQLLVIVRDDFWTPTAGFFEQLEVPLARDRNLGSLELFDALHAAKVLQQLGQAYDRLPRDAQQMTPDQQAFVQAAVAELSRDNRVYCLQLAMFAELMKGRPWATKELTALGGMAGLGTIFLEETFAGATAPPHYRKLETAIRAVLKALLPPPGRVTKVRQRTKSELRAAADLVKSPLDFDKTVRILDGDTRLIITMQRDEPDADIDLGISTNNGSSQPLEPVYRLTHDYLVPSIREWVRRKQQGTWRGRSEVILESRSEAWAAEPAPRYLPSWAEFVSILLTTNRDRWTPNQVQMLSTAGRRYGAQLALAIVACGLLLAVALYTRSSLNAFQADLLVAHALDVSPAGFPFAVEKVVELEAQTAPLLQQRLSQRDLTPQHRLRALLALRQMESGEVDAIVDCIGKANPGECENIVATLSPHRTIARPVLISRMNVSEDPLTDFRLAVVLMHLGDTYHVEEMCRVDADPAARTIFVHQLANWHGSFRELLRLLETSRSADLQSAICLAIGQFPESTWSATERSDLSDLVLSLYRTSPHAATHSAAGRLLRIWNQPLPEVPAGEPRDGRGWYLNQLGMTFLQLPAGEIEIQRHERAASETFKIGKLWALDREVTFGDFSRFAEDPEHKQSLFAWRSRQAVSQFAYSNDHPAISVAWCDTILFCNWLSRLDGLQPCYEPTGERESFDGFEMPVYDLQEDHDGYRLPTCAEWEYLCRANSRTTYHFGDDSSLLTQYAVCCEQTCQPLRSRLPNGWGLFDMHGNQLEWCYDLFSEWSSPVAPRLSSAGLPVIDRTRSLRGGNFLQGVALNNSLARGRFSPSARNTDLGFRIVRNSRDQ